MSDAFNQGLAACIIAEQGEKQVAIVVYLVALAGSGWTHGAEGAKKIERLEGCLIPSSV